MGLPASRRRITISPTTRPKTPVGRQYEPSFFGGDMGDRGRSIREANVDLSVTCECGIKTQVEPAMCGSSVACDCGKTIQIPRLSELRRNSGLTPVIVGVADKLQAMFVDGLLPTEVDCVSCRSPTNLYLACEIECERMFAKKPSYALYFLQFCFTPIWILAATKREYDNPEVHGRELVVKTPIRICETCFSEINLNRETCIGLMQANELYAKLLARYPNATVVWETAIRRSNKAMDAKGSVTAL